MNQKKRIVVLLSGSGSNLQALIDACELCQNSQPSIEPYGALDANIVAVISNRPATFGIERAKKAGIPSHVIDHTQFDDRSDFDAALLRTVQNYEPDLVILAGFMRILTPLFITQFYGRLLNIHPSLLPKYTGLHTHQRALDAGDCQHGVTVHFVSEELDGGPPIIQATVPILEGDTVGTLAKRVQEQEYIIYPLASQWFVQGRLQLHNGRAILDDEILPLSGALYNDDLLC